MIIRTSFCGNPAVPKYVYLGVKIVLEASVSIFLIVCHFLLQFFFVLPSFLGNGHTCFLLLPRSIFSLRLSTFYRLRHEYILLQLGNVLSNFVISPKLGTPTFVNNQIQDRSFKDKAAQIHFAHFKSSDWLNLFEKPIGLLKMYCAQLL